jgi:inner membrane protein
MDPITQSLLGAAVAQATLGKRLGPAAALFGAVGGELPDIDVFFTFADPALPMQYHRHFTHALVFIPFGGALAALPMLAVPRWRRRWRSVLMATTIGCATHGLLDTCTAYGTHLLWPFVNARLAWDIISIIDPVFTLTLLIGLVWALASQSMRPARVALIAAMAYLGVGAIQHHRAMAVQADLAETRGHVIERRRVMPTLGNLVVWRSIYETDGRLNADVVRVGRSGLVRQGGSVERSRLDDLPVDTPRVREVFDGLEAFADGYVAEVADRPGVFGDMRYSMEPSDFDPLWGIRVGPAGPNPDVTWVHMVGNRPGALGRRWRQVVDSEGWE